MGYRTERTRAKAARRTWVARGTLALVAVLAWADAVAVSAQQSRTRERADPPDARRGSHVQVYHGVQVADPYRWMEDLDAPETVAWARAQDEAARAFAAAVPGRDRLRDRMAAIARAWRYAPQAVADGRAFLLNFPATGPGAGGRLLAMDDPTAEPRVVLDPEAEGSEGTVLLVRPSPDGRFLAYGLGPRGSNWMTLRVRDLRSGRDLPGSVEGLHRSGSSVSWLPDGSGFYYDRFDRPEAGAEGTARLANERILFHRIAASFDRDVELRRSEDADRTLSHSVTADGRHLVVTERVSATGHNRVLLAEGGAASPDALRPLIPEADARYAFVGSHGGELWFNTTLDAPRGRVVAVDPDDPGRERWTELVPESDATVSSWVGVAAIGGRIVVGYLRDAVLTPRVYDHDGTMLYDVELPGMRSMWTGFVGRADHPYAYYTATGVADPGSVYRIDIRTGESELVIRPELSYDPDDFVTRQVFYEGRDGTRIPMFLAHRRDLELDRPHPTFMYGYGFGAWPAAPWFQANMVLWLESGGIWALPNTRGGGAYGEEWHQAAVGVRKQTAIDDYVAATEWLMERGITSPDLMVANGSSAGGAVTGGAVTQRPELYGGAVLDYPVLDMLRYEQFTVGPSWVADYGSVENEAEFRALLDYSPVHNVEPGVCYPATLVAPGELDQTTPPLHAYKFVAALQHAQGCDEPILLRMSWGAGHSAGATLDRAVENWADQLAFLKRVLGEDAFGG